MSKSTDTAEEDEGTPSRENAGSEAGADDLAQQFSRLARTLQKKTAPDDMIEEIVSSAVHLIPGVDEGSISTVRDRRSVTSLGASGDLPDTVDKIQQEVGQGPCLDAVYEQQTVRVADMRHEQRWPLFASRAYEAGAGSMLSFQLFVEGDNLGALNLYARDPDAFDDESEHVGLLFASHAAVAYAEVQKVQEMSRAIETRDLIGQAKGILMERYGIDGQRAFSLLSRISQTENRKLRDVAQQLVEVRELGQASQDE